MLFIGYFSGKWRSDKTTQTCVLSKHYKLELLDICVICVIFCITVYPHLSVHPRRPPGAPYRLSAGLAPYPGRSSSSRPGSTNTSPGSAVTGAPGPGLLPPEPPEPGLLPPEGGRGVREGVGKELEAGLDSPPPAIVKYEQNNKLLDLYLCCRSRVFSALRLLYCWMTLLLLRSYCWRGRHCRGRH